MVGDSRHDLTNLSTHELTVSWTHLLIFPQTRVLMNSCAHVLMTPQTHVLMNSCAHVLVYSRAHALTYTCSCKMSSSPSRLLPLLISFFNDKLLLVFTLSQIHQPPATSCNLHYHVSTKKSILDLKRSSCTKNFEDYS